MPADVRTTLLSVLMRHQGAATGITAAELALQTGITKRRVRSLVSKLRLDGTAVCGHPSTGYYIGVTPEEIERTCAFLRSRAMHSLTLESKLRHVPLPELLGQMRLKT
jgi:DNA-binding IclR family transcriptional regulator